MAREPVLVSLCASRRIDSAAGGAVATHVLSAPDHYRLALGVDEIVVGADLTALDANAGVAIRIEWSWDGLKWRLGTTVITEKTAVDVYTGVFNTAAERTPFVRVIAEVRDVTTTAPVGATLDAWALYKYNA